MTIISRQSGADPLVLFFLCCEGSSMQHKKATTVLLSSVLAVSLLGGCRASDKPVTLTVWTYYNGDQLASFERLVEEFNTTIGKKEHITVEASSQGSINDLKKMFSMPPKEGLVPLPCQIFFPLTPIPPIRLSRWDRSWIFPLILHRKKRLPIFPITWKKVTFPMTAVSTLF